jgi:hypothetical protein
LVADAVTYELLLRARFRRRINRLDRKLRGLNILPVDAGLHQFVDHRCHGASIRLGGFLDRCRPRADAASHLREVGHGRGGTFTGHQNLRLLRIRSF